MRSHSHLIRSGTIAINLVYRFLNPLGFVAFKMGHRQGGPTRTGGRSRPFLYSSYSWSLGQHESGARRSRRATQPPVGDINTISRRRRSGRPPADRPAMAETASSEIRPYPVCLPQQCVGQKQFNHPRSRDVCESGRANPGQGQADRSPCARVPGLSHPLGTNSNNTLYHCYDLLCSRRETAAPKIAAEMALAG
jgi:hypothetical protein